MVRPSDSQALRWSDHLTVRLSDGLTVTLSEDLTVRPSDDPRDCLTICGLWWGSSWKVFDEELDP